MPEHYELRPGAVTRTKDAALIAEALEAIRARHGALVPRVVWQESADADAPLHAEFCWDDQAAADLFRDHQARSLIRAVRVVSDAGRSTPAYLHVHVQSTSCYQPLAIVLATPDLRRQALEDAERYLRAARQRLADLEGVADVLGKVDAAIAGIERKRPRKRR